MPQKIIVIYYYYQALGVFMIKYGLGLLTVSNAQFKRIETIQNKGMKAIFGYTKDAPTAQQMS